MLRSIRDKYSHCNHVYMAFTDHIDHTICAKKMLQPYKGVCVDFCPCVRLHDGPLGDAADVYIFIYKLVILYYTKLLKKK